MIERQGFKHLVRCRCVLPQFKANLNPPVHQFVVFSIIESDVVRPKYAQCNNCGLIHKITEIGKSEILQGKENLSSIVSIDELKASLPTQLAAILENNNVDLPTWELAKFIYENKQWGNFVVLKRDNEDGINQIKYVIIVGETLFRVDSHLREG